MSGEFYKKILDMQLWIINKKNPKKMKEKTKN